MNRQEIEAMLIEVIEEIDDNDDFKPFNEWNDYYRLPVVKIVEKHLRSSFLRQLAERAND